MRSLKGLRAAALAGLALGAVTAFADSVPLMLNEVGEARADRSAWSQASEFVSLILDSGWAWATTAVLAGWLLGRRRPLRAALAGFLSLAVATVVFYGVELLFADGGAWGEVRFWWVRSLVLGPPLGVIGSLTRRLGLIGALAALVIPAGALLNLAALPLPDDSRMSRPVLLTIYAAAALAAILIVTRGVRTRMQFVPRTSMPTPSP